MAVTPMPTVAIMPATPPGPLGSALPRPAAGGITGADLIRAIRQRIFLVIGLWLLFIGMTVGITFIVQMYYPLYSANALVQCISLQAANPNDPLNTAVTRMEDMERLLLDQSLLASSPTVIREVLTDPRVRGTAWFRHADQEFKRDPTKGLEDALAEAVAVAPIRRSSMLKVVAEVPNPKDAPILANALVEKYIEVADRISKAGYQSNETNLTQRRNALRGERDNKKRAIDEHLLRFPYVTTMAAGQRTSIDDDVTYNNALKNDFETQALNYKNQWELLERFGTQGIPVTDEILALVESDPLIVQYRQELSRYEQARLSSMQKLGPNHRVVREHDAQIADLKDKLEAARNDATNRYVTQQREEARRQYQQSRAILVRLEENYDEALNRQADQQEKLKQYRDMMFDYEQLQTKVEELTKNIDQLAAVINRTRTVQIAVSSEAVEPQKRSRPNWLLYVPIGVGFGLLLSLGIAWLLEYTDSTVRTARDVERHGRLPVLGVIPTAEDDEVHIEQIETATLNQPTSVTAEAFRTMRTNLFFAAPAEKQGALLIASPSPGEGKTTVAVNLAAAIAMSGRRVLLIDANFRRPTLRTFFPQARAEGLSNILVGQGRLQELVNTTTLTGLDVLSTGPVPPNPAELLGSGYLRDMLAEARSRYDQIIFDGPPVLLVSDALVLSGLIDGVILVSRFRQTSRGALQRAQAQLDAIGARILGAVLNAVQTTRGGYFREQYRAFYEYHPEAELPPAKSGKSPDKPG